jgi:hypothetical protein
MKMNMMNTLKIISNKNRNKLIKKKKRKAMMITKNKIKPMIKTYHKTIILFKKLE